RITFLPVVVAEILMGIIIGHSFLDIVERDAMLNILSTLGFIFLMFLSGLEIDFKAFKKEKNVTKDKEKSKEPEHLQLALYVFILGVVVPTLFEICFMCTNISQFIFLFAVLVDLVTIILLTLYGALHESGVTLLWLIGSLVVFAIIFYLLGGIFKKAQFLQKLM